VGNDVDWRCTNSHPTSEDGVTLPFLHPIVSTSLEDIDASSFIGPSLHLHTSLRCMEVKMYIWAYYKSAESSYTR
jgi:hypothetical protein